MFWWFIDETKGYELNAKPRNGREKEDTNTYIPIVDIAHSNKTLLLVWSLQQSLTGYTSWQVADDSNRNCCSVLGMEPFGLKYLSSIVVYELVYTVDIPQYCYFITSEEVLVFALIDPYSSFISYKGQAQILSLFPYIKVTLQVVRSFLSHFST